MRNRRRNISIGFLCSGLAASILAVQEPYYALFASIALIVILAIWIAILAKS